MKKPHHLAMLGLFAWLLDPGLNQGPTDEEQSQCKFLSWRILAELGWCPACAPLVVRFGLAGGSVRRWTAYAQTSARSSTRRGTCRYGIESGEKLLGAAKLEHDGDTAVNPESSIRHKGRSPDTSLHQGFSTWLLDLGSNQGPTD
ncbi:hypothetical protein [Roseateles microcysteis]|uniref:hypothetical protein n=1 Tax=Roseateles microcysteis TaxID=3119057 RepID=UPI002FE688AA